MKLLDRIAYIALGLVCGLPLYLLAGHVDVTNTFTNGAVADANDVNQNFNEVELAIDDNDARLDKLESRRMLDAKAIGSITSSFSTVLTLDVSDHRGAFVRVYLTGDWGDHSAVSYYAGFHVQNGGGAYAEPGGVAFEYDNTATDDGIVGLVTNTGDTFNIQLRTDDGGNGYASGTSTFNAPNPLNYEIVGTFSNVL